MKQFTVIRHNLSHRPKYFSRHLTDHCRRLSVERGFRGIRQPSLRAGAPFKLGDDRRAPPLPAEGRLIGSNLVALVPSSTKVTSALIGVVNRHSKLTF